MAQQSLSVLVCQNRACRKKGSARVLRALQGRSPEHVEVRGCACLGQCGCGPMVLVLPEEVWYDRVSVAEVPAVVERHLRGGEPIKTMLYRKFHQGE